jgi:glycosyltransferase involved in cell wall biosynthesis
MLALEVPVVTNSGVGDVDRIMAEAGSGVVIDRFDENAYRGALDELDCLKPDKKRSRNAVRRWFDLETGVERYDAIYHALARAAVGSQRALR